MFIIEDTLHCEYNLDERYETFELALQEVRRRVALPWDEAPNRAPCTSWRTCGRAYLISERDTSTMPFACRSSTPIVRITGDGVVWEPGFAPD